jgi:uncharacterized membrane protein
MSESTIPRSILCVDRAPALNGGFGNLKDGLRALFCDRMSDGTAAPAKPRPRIESLSDMIFGLALSVGAITLVSSPPLTVNAIFSDLITFAFSFIILITIWLRYTRIMSALPLESPRIVKLNIILLFLVSTEPFLFNIVRRPPTVIDPGAYNAVTSTLYALDIGVMMLILGFFTLSLADEEKKLIPKELMRQFRNESLTWFATGGLFLVSAIPVFYTIDLLADNPVRYAMWSVAMVIPWVARGSKRLTHRDTTETSAH